MRHRKRGVRIAAMSLLVCGCIVFGIVAIPLVGVGVQCGVFGGVNPAKTVRTSNLAEVSTEIQKIKEGLSGYTRSEEQTYLTLPEWYIVYSADEYAAFIDHNLPSQFPYFQAIGDYWRSYYNVCTVTRGQYAFNTGYHLSLAIIGTSFTLENLLKGLYEKTFGRVTEWLSAGALTEEDAYARKVAKEYGDFIHTIPWYAFAFGEKLTGLWGGTSLWGPHGLRKWERKLALSLEYGVKSMYGWLIKHGTQATYAPEDLAIQVWAEGLSDEVLTREPQLRIVKAIDTHAAIVALPRYEAYTHIVRRLVRQGVQFVEMAGNHDILITVIAPHNWSYDLQDGAFLFAMPIRTQPQRQRVAVQAPVKSLHRVLNMLESRHIEIEHIYDY